MENILLVIHLILALCLVGVVLLQRSEGGGLGMGGGGGGVMTGRQAATALSKVTWGFAAAFLCTSIGLTILSARNSADTSVLDRIGVESSQELLPPSAEESDGPAVPPASSDTPVAPPRLD